MADWKAIETEYITTDTSYRKLADKYGLDQATISRKAKKEDWVGKRQHHVSTTQAKVLAADAKQKVSRAEKLMEVGDLLLQKVKERVEALNPLEMGSQEFRHLSATIKDLKEIHMIKSDEDRQEQEARIANLRRQAQEDSGEPGVIEVVFAAGPEEWNE